MSEQEEKPEKKSRRKFLQELGIVGIGSVLGGSAILAGINYDKKKDCRSACSGTYSRK